MARYGENFRRLREANGLSQEEVARRLKITRQGNFSKLEKSTHVPGVQTILRHATALGCSPSDLMRDVETEHDRIRAGAYDDTTTRTQIAHRRESRTVASERL